MKEIDFVSCLFLPALLRRPPLLTGAPLLLLLLLWLVLLILLLLLWLFDAELVDVLKCFLCLALMFWNQTCVTLLDNPVKLAMRSKSWPSGFESSKKLACRTWSCSSVNVVRTRFDFDRPPPSGSVSLKKKTKLNFFVNLNFKNFRHFRLTFKPFFSPLLKLSLLSARWFN